METLYKIAPWYHSAKLYPMKVYMPLFHSIASLIIQPLLQALLFWSPIEGQCQLRQFYVSEIISVHTTVHVSLEIFTY